MTSLLSSALLTIALCAWCITAQACPRVMSTRRI